MKFETIEDHYEWHAQANTFAPRFEYLAEDVKEGWRRDFIASKKEPEKATDVSYGWKNDIVPKTIGERIALDALVTTWRNATTSEDDDRGQYTTTLKGTVLRDVSDTGWGNMERSFRFATTAWRALADLIDQGLAPQKEEGR